MSRAARAEQSRERHQYRAGAEQSSTGRAEQHRCAAQSSATQSRADEQSRAKRAEERRAEHSAWRESERRAADSEWLEREREREQRDIERALGREQSAKQSRAAQSAEQSRAEQREHQSRAEQRRAEQSRERERANGEGLMASGWERLARVASPISGGVGAVRGREDDTPITFVIDGNSYFIYVTET